MSYIPKTYRKDGGDTFVVASGGQILVEPGGSVMGGNPTGAADYWVDGNVSATGDGSLNDPYLTLKEAITASNISIALTANRWWARRNRIFVMGDQEIDEDLTVGAEKCDIIGIGTDLHPFPRILGNHAFASKCTGMRLINLGFISTGAGALIIIPDLQHGFQALGCHFWPKQTGTTHGIHIIGSSSWKIIGCRFLTSSSGATLFAEGIKQEDGTGQGHDGEIFDNFIRATEGIHIESGCAPTGQAARIDNNVIYATVLTVNDADDKSIITRNMLISDAVAASTGAGAITGNTALAAGNRLTCSDHLNAPWPLEGTLAG